MLDRHEIGSMLKKQGISYTWEVRIEGLLVDLTIFEQFEVSKSWQRRGPIFNCTAKICCVSSHGWEKMYGWAVANFRAISPNVRYPQSKPFWYWWYWVYSWLGYFYERGMGLTSDVMSSGFDTFPCKRLKWEPPSPHDSDPNEAQWTKIADCWSSQVWSWSTSNA